MSPAAISILGFGVYLATGGLLLFLVPQELCQFLHLRPPGDSMWVRLGGLFFLDLAFYCIQAAINEQRSFIRWSQKTRPWTIVFLGIFVALGLENPSILIFGVIDLLATLWTALALRSSEAAANGMTTPEVSPPKQKKALQSPIGHADNLSAVAVNRSDRPGVARLWRECRR